MGVRGKLLQEGSCAPECPSENAEANKAPEGFADALGQ